MQTEEIKYNVEKFIVSRSSQSIVFWIFTCYFQVPKSTIMNTSFFTDINWLAVAVAAIAYFALGAVWYSGLFGKRWVAYQNIIIDENAKKGVGAIMFSSFLLMGVSVICLAILVERLQLTQAISGVKLGLLTGVGFAVTSLSISYLYVKKPLGLYLIDGMYHVLGNIIAAIILCVWH